MIAFFKKLLFEPRLFSALSNIGTLLKIAYKKACKYNNLFHPNIYTNGNVCISILHEGIDEFGYESVSERWNPSQSVNSILISILSMLSAPNFESPANVDASKMWRDNFEDYKKIVYKMVSDSQK